MANVIKPKRSYTASTVPTGLVAGEIAVNATDGKIWICNAAGTVNVLVSSLAHSDHTGTLGVANGGTGATTLTANNVILGNGTSAPSFVAPSTSGNLLTSNGTTWASTAPAAQMPTGALMPYAGATAPTGYLLCDGSSVSSTTYLALHAIISNTYGGTAYSGAGSLSFNLPDLRGRVPIGSGTGTGLTARVTGTTYGADTHTVSSSNITQFSTGNMSANAAHTHPGFAHPLLKYVGTGGNRADLAAGGAWIGTDSSPTTVTSQSTEHTHTVGNASPTGISNLQPSLGLNYIIKT